MSDATGNSKSGEYAIMPRQLVRRRYVVVVTQVDDEIRHEQTFRETVPAIAGIGRTSVSEAVPPVAAVMGYVTVAKNLQTESVLFRAEFTTRPKISDLAKLMEDGAP